MKPKHSARPLASPHQSRSHSRNAFPARPALCAILLLGSIQISGATTYYWDADGTAAGNDVASGAGLGGTGTWNTTNTFWYDPNNSAADAAFTVTTDTAVFAGTGGTVTLTTSGNTTAGTTQILSSGYTLQGTSKNFQTNNLTIGAGVTGTKIYITGGNGILNIDPGSGGTATYTNTDLVDFGATAWAFGGNGRTLNINNSTSSGVTTISTLGLVRNNTTSSNSIGGSGNVTIHNLAGTLNFATPIALTASGASQLTYNGTGILTLDGNNTLWNDTTAGTTLTFKLSSGTLALGNDNALGAVNGSGGATGSIFNLAGGAVTATAARSIANTTTLTANSIVGGSNNLVLSGSFTNSGGNRTLTDNNTGTTTLSGTVYLSEAETARTLAISTSVAGTTISGLITNDSGANTVASSLTKSGTGTLTLSNAANTYGGVTTVNGGVLSVGTLANGGSASSIGQSSNAAGNLVLSSSGTLQYTGGTVTIDRNLTVGSGGGGIAVSQAGATLTVAGASTGGNMLTTSGAGSVVFTGAVGGGSGANLNVTGGSATLSGTNDDSYLTATVSSGTLVLGKTSSGSVHSIGAGGGGLTGLTINGGGVQLGGSGGDQIWDSAQVVMNAGTFDLNNQSETIYAITGSSGAVITNNAATSGTGTLTLNNSSTFAGTIKDGGNGGVTAIKTSGASTVVTLSGSNTYSGPTNIGAGVLSVSSLANGGSASGIGSASNAATNLVFNNSTLQYTGGTASSDRNFSGNGATIEVTQAGTTLMLSGTSFVNFTKIGAGTLAMSGALSFVSPTVSAGTLIISGTGDNNSVGATINSGTLVLAKSSSGTVHAVGGAINLNGGTLQLAGSGGDQIYYQSSVNMNAAGTTFDLNGTSEEINGLTGVAGATVTNNGSGTSELKVGANNATVTFAGSIQDGGSGGIVAFTKEGTGTQTLSGTSTYSGATNVTAGTLLISGSLSGTTQVNVASGATLDVSALTSGFTVPTGKGIANNGAVAGNLTINGKLTGSGTNNGTTSIVGGTLSPGNDSSSAGTLSLNNTVSLTNGTFLVNIDGSNSDKLSISGDLTLSGSDALTLNILNTATASSYVIAIYSGTLTGTFSDISSLVSRGFTIDYGTGLNSQITLMAVPEPATWAMIVGGLGMLAFNQKLRRRKM